MHGTAVMRSRCLELLVFGGGLRVSLVRRLAAMRLCRTRGFLGRGRSIDIFAVLGVASWSGLLGVDRCGNMQWCYSRVLHRVSAWRERPIFLLLGGADGSAVLFKVLQSEVGGWLCVVAGGVGVSTTPWP